ncbi:hypothetical protein FG386_003436 [Cryptosporidium ryanae]|uniref:uncharacterized protein n=1 Tax=Cryptosporidium ryanae TaxID=515981 RepID=UPI00351A89DE|nr:hypothetical protein FG386_003436 [Cryptosporidium ryanae]
MSFNNGNSSNNAGLSGRVTNTNDLDPSIASRGIELTLDNQAISYKVSTDNCEFNEAENTINNSVFGSSDLHKQKLKRKSKNEDHFGDDSSIYLDKFKNKKLESWNPIYTPNYLLFMYFVFGALFTAVGIYLLTNSNSTIECEIKYEDSPGNGVTIDTIVEVTSENCKPSHIQGKELSYISGDVYMYYRLHNFYQNNRNYILNRSEKQLKGETIKDKSEISSCHPLITDESSNILLPCGIAASRVFNDTYTVFDGEGDPVTIDDSAETITLLSDREKYKNPSEEYIRENNVSNWLPEDIFPGRIENPHFIVWMRNSATSDFNKLYGKLTSNKNRLVLPLKVHVQNRYPCSVFSGSKYIVISQIKWFGGKNPYFGLLYIVSGTFMLLFFVFFLIKNKTSVGVPGDLRFLYLNVLDGESKSKKRK